MAERTVRTPEEKRELVNARQRGVHRAWEREKHYVEQGRGTRDWTPEQQEQILHGSGRAEGYHGHHMKSCSLYPKYADDPDNIQFLSYDEHLNGAHKSDYHNRTNGYYDPETGVMHDFGRRKPEAVEAKSLSRPLEQQREAESRSSAFAQDAENAGKRESNARSEGSGFQRDQESPRNTSQTRQNSTHSEHQESKGGIRR